MNVITNSMRSTFFECPFKFFIEYILRISPKKKAVYFTWGSLVHALAEAQDLEQDITAAIKKEETKFYQELLVAVLPNTEQQEKVLQMESSDEIVDAFANYITPTMVSEIRAFTNMCTSAEYVMQAHQERWKNEAKRYEQLGVETTFSLPLKDSNGWTFRGKIDKIVRDTTTGDIWQWERKTASQTGQSYYTALSLDSQPRGYLLAVLKLFGYKAQGAIYDVFKKPRIKKHINETDEEFAIRLGETYLAQQQKYFERTKIAIPIQVIEDYEEEITEVTRMIDFCLQNAYWPPQHSKFRIGTCAYYPLCKQSFDWEKWDLQGYYIRPLEQFNPELENEKE